MNPSKTTADKIFNDGMKNEEVVFVRGINCTPEFAKAQMQETKDEQGNKLIHLELSKERLLMD